MKKCIVNSILAIVLITMFASSCNSTVSKPTNSSVASLGLSSTIESMTSQNISSYISNQAQQNTISEKMLAKGTYTVGQDIAPGRYNITTQATVYVNLDIWNTDGGNAVISEMLGDPIANPGLSGLVTSVTCTLVNGQTISIDSSAPGQDIASCNLNFNPYISKFSNKLSCGVWEVGIDINAGTYNIAPKQGNDGHFTITRNNNTIIDQYLGDANIAGAVPDLQTTLKDGDIIYISGMDIVNFTK